MKAKRFLTWGVGLICLSWFAPGFAADVDSLQRQINVLSDELENMKLGGGPAGTGHDRIKVHGYGELHFNHRPDSGRTEIDQHRFVVGIHALLTDWIHLNAEIDYEHAAQELEFELAHLDFLLDPKFNVRAGVMLLPVGLLNEFHEPNLFWSVERPQFQSKIIPTTWSGAGAGLFGTPFEGVNYRLYAVNSVQSVRPAGFSTGGGSGGSGGQGGRFRSSSGIRSGRQQINELIAEDFAAVGRLELTRLYPGLQLGFSFYTGDTTHGLLPGDEGGRILLLEGDVKYRAQWFEMNASIANIDIDDASALNAFCASSAGDCSEDIPDNIFGWNVQAGVHLPQLLGMNTSHDLVPWFMFERIKPQDSVPDSTARTPGVNFDVYTWGLVYLPIPEVAVKMDYQHFIFENADFGAGKADRSKDQFNIGIAYMY